MQPTENRDATQAPAATTVGPSSKPAQQWAIVELFGHARIAGAITEQAFGGGALVRVDVPAITLHEEIYVDGLRTTGNHTIPAHTRSFGAGAIYSINWCDEAGALVAAYGIRHEPLRPYSLRTALNGMPEGERQRLLALTAGSAVFTGADDDAGDLAPF